MVSTKVGCGRFDGKRSRAAPDLLANWKVNDSALFTRTKREPDNTEKHLPRCYRFTDICARHRAGRESDAGAPPATAVWAAICGDVERLYFEALKSGLQHSVRSGRASVTVCSHTMPIADAQRSVARAQDYGRLPPYISLYRKN